MNTLKILQSTSERVNTINLAVAITVIALLFIVLAISFFLYYRYYRKCIDNKLEDAYIKKEIKGENKKFFDRFNDLLTDRSLVKSQKIARYKEDTLVDYVSEGADKRNGLKIFGNTMLGIVYVAFIALIAFAGYVRASGEQFMIGNTYYVIILTGSMEEARDSNTYLAANNLTNQISTFSLIGLDKVDSEDDIELYDIVGYYDEDGDLVVHRVISIRMNEEYQKIYTLRGDANAFSDTDERDLTIDQIDSKYNGYQNFGLGITLNYLRSNIGIISLALGIILIMVYDTFDILLGKAINKRKEFIYPIIDKENIKLIINYDDYITGNEEFREIYSPDEGVANNAELRHLLRKLRHNPPYFYRKLNAYPASLSKQYNAIKDYCFYHGLRGVFRDGRFDFHLKGIRLLSMTVDTNGLLVHLRLNPLQTDDIAFSSMLFPDYNKAYKDIRVCFYENENTNPDWAKAVIDVMMMRLLVETKKQRLEEIDFQAFYREPVNKVK